MARQGPAAGAAGSRPATRRRGPRGRGRPDAQAPAPRRFGLTGRAAVLAIVTAVVAVMLALPLKVYISQRHAISQLQQQTQAQQQAVARLKQEAARWNDPAYVRAQARERLHLVMPGETAYIVLGGGKGAETSTSGSPRPPLAVPHTTADVSAQPWYGRLWDTVEASGGHRG